jgi:uncharacterized protein YcbX
VQVTALYVYPVKACAGVSVSSADVQARGFARDRRWMVVDEHGRFVSQREAPVLARVRVALLDSGLRLSAPGLPDLELPAECDGEPIEVEVWGYRGAARRHAGASAWFSDHLKRRAGAVYMADDERRPTSRTGSAPGDIVSFADGYPFLCVSEQSLADLNARLAAPIDVRRFRPNIVISGAAPYAEDRWHRVAIGPVAFRMAKRCDRCSVTTVDPDSGERGAEPLQTLAAYRREDGKVWFGVNLIHDGSGTLRVGDAVVELG